MTTNMLISLLAAFAYGLTAGLLTYKYIRWRNERKCKVVQEYIAKELTSLINQELEDTIIEEGLSIINE